MHRRIAKVILVVGVLGVAVGGTGAETVEAAQEPWTGRIVDFVSNEPIAGAAVTPFSDRWWPRNSDLEAVEQPLPGVATGPAVAGRQDGTFSIVAQGASSLVVRAPGYSPGFVDLPAARDHDLGAVGLRRTAALSGRIVRPDGEPVAGSRVGLGQDLVVTTDATGSFRFERIALASAWSTLAVESAGLVRSLGPLPRSLIDIGPIPVAETYTVSGTVVDAADVPVPGASVTAARVQSTTSYARAGELLWIADATDDDGRFDLQLPSGGHVLRVQPPGRVAEEHRVDVPVGGLELAPVAIESTVRVYGRVVDANGQPVAGVRVQRESPWGSPPSDAPLATAVTDADGQYELEVSRAREPSSPQSIALVLRRPAESAPEIEVEKRVDVDLGAPEQADAVFPRDGMGIVGRVVDVAGNALAGARVSASLQTGGQVNRFMETRSGEDGSFKLLNVGASGHWSVAAELPGSEAPELPRVEVVDNLATEILVMLRPVSAAETVELTILRADGSPASYAHTSIYRPTRRPELEPVWIRRHADGSGFVRIEGVENGSYRIDVTAWGADGEWSTLDPSGSETTVDVELGDTRETIAIVLPAARRQRGVLVGRILDHDGDPVGGAQVEAEGARDERPRNFRRLTTSDGDGWFRFDNIAVGRYDVHAERDDLARSDGVSARATTDGTRDVELRMEPGATIVGRLVGLSPDEIRGAWVGLDGAQAVVRDDGTFRVEHAGRGSQTISGYTHTERRIDARVDVPVDADLVETTLEFPRGFTLGGAISFHGQPVTEGWVTVLGSPEGQGFVHRSVPVASNGTYAAADLPPADYRLLIRVPPMESQYPVDEISVSASTELDVDVRGWMLGGRVVDAQSGAPIGESRIRLGSPVNFTTHSFPGFPPVAPDGTFGVGPLAEGPWRVTASADGYTTEELRLDLSDDAEDLVFALEPTPGLRLRFNPPNDQSLGRVRLIWESIDGSENIDVSYRPRGENEYWWEIVSRGEGVLTIADRDTGLAYRGRIDNTGDWMEITLEPAGQLDLLIPSLSDAARFEALLFDADGRRLPRLPFGLEVLGTNQVGARPWRRLIRVPAGGYTIEIIEADGTTWRYEFEVAAGELLGDTLR